MNIFIIIKMPNIIKLNKKIRKELESLNETIEILSDPEAMKEIADSIKEYEDGKKGKTLESIKARISRRV